MGVFLATAQFIGKEGRPVARDIIVLTSITYAYKAQKLLEQAWIKSEVIRTPEGLSTKGCSYSLAIRGDTVRAEELLKQNGIRILKIVRQA